MIIFDTETTGLIGPITMPLSKQPRIIEICLIKLEDKSLKEIERYTTLINPGFLISPVITKITGITNEMLKGAPSFEKVSLEIERILRGERYIVAHNLPFDRKMLTFDFERIGKDPLSILPPKGICTVASTMHISGKRLNMEKLYAHCTLGGKFESAHRASADTEALARCVRFLVEKGDIVLR